VRDAHVAAVATTSWTTVGAAVMLPLSGNHPWVALVANPGVSSLVLTTNAVDVYGALLLVLLLRVLKVLLAWRAGTLLEVGRHSPSPGWTTRRLARVGIVLAPSAVAAAASGGSGERLRHTVAAALPMIVVTQLGYAVAYAVDSETIARIADPVLHLPLVVSSILGGAVAVCVILSLIVRRSRDVRIRRSTNGDSERRAL
jgi:hypothetical protein